MLTMKIFESEDGIFENVDDAINYIKETNFRNEISVYDTNDDKAYKKTKEIYKAIKEYNKGKPLNSQILPGNPFHFRGILGCLGVNVYTITLGTYEKNHNCIAFFTGYNDTVLDTSVELPNIIPGLKALSSLALIGKICKNNSVE